MRKRHLLQFFTIDSVSVLSDLLDEMGIRDRFDTAEDAKTIRLCCENVMMEIIKEIGVINKKDERQYQRVHAISGEVVAELQEKNEIEAADYIAVVIALADECAKVTSCKIRIHRLWVQMCDALMAIYDKFWVKAYIGNPEYDFIARGTSIADKIIDGISRV